MRVHEKNYEIIWDFFMALPRGHAAQIYLKLPKKKSQDIFVNSLLLNSEESASEANRSFFLIGLLAGKLIQI